ncbi:hypothetical protein QBC38DRAFT_400521 [Podospora fimiseda]|uniref:Uncharacterized protein n=1 Tax=Podospora fimiseda TaxID=252190 RepID=A0AAN6YQW4_9PEZI|nr:hypothetical protein QBC38DRAFT_400521 [Podospora fimiseda]
MCPITNLKMILLAIVSFAASLILAAPTLTTSSTAAATCSNGIPEDKQHSSEYPLENYTNVVPIAAKDWKTYKINPDWYKAHFVSGPHISGFRQSEKDFGAFKCSFTCNAAGDDCSSFFIWFDNPGGALEQMNCVLFDAVVSEGDFVKTDDDTATFGAYDRICKTDE